MTSVERDQIYRMLDQDDQRGTILSFGVGLIALTRDGSEQILVRGTGPFCGATGNCSMWIFVRKAGQLGLGLRTIGQFMIVRNLFTGGFHDIAIGLHGSAFEHQFTDYRWDGVIYKRVDCYLTQYRITAHASDRPKIVGCR